MRSISVARGEHENGRGRLLAKDARDFEAVQFGEHDIEDDEIGLEFARRVERGASISDCFNGETILFEVVEEGISERGLVFDDEDCFGHGFFFHIEPDVVSRRRGGTTSKLDCWQYYTIGYFRGSFNRLPQFARQPSEMRGVTDVVPARTRSRSIKTLRSAEIRAAALQYARKVSGYRKPSRVNEAAFERAVEEVAEVTQKLLNNPSVKATS